MNMTTNDDDDPVFAQYDASCDRLANELMRIARRLYRRNFDAMLDDVYCVRTNTCDATNTRQRAIMRAIEQHMQRCEMTLNDACDDANDMIENEQ